MIQKNSLYLIDKTTQTRPYPNHFHVSRMPVIKIFCAQRPEADACERLSQALRDLCIGPMGAQPDAIQLMLVPGVQMLDGAPVFVEAHYRDRPDRKGSALVQFLAGVDQAVQLAFGQEPRIRSFAVAQSTLGAVR